MGEKTKSAATEEVETKTEATGLGTGEATGLENPASEPAEENVVADDVVHTDAVATLAAGTKFKLADREVTLLHPTEVTFDGAGEERVLVGMLVLSENLDVNRTLLRKNYDSLGNEIPEA